MWTNEELAWLAGFIDGEGHMGVGRAGSAFTYSCQMQIANSDKSVIDYCQVVFDCRVVSTNPSNWGRPTHKIMYYGSWSSTKAKVLVPLIRPFLRCVKKQQAADLLMEFINLCPGRGIRLDNDSLLKRANLYARSLELHKRGR